MTCEKGQQDKTNILMIRTQTRRHNLLLALSALLFPSLNVQAQAKVLPHHLRRLHHHHHYNEISNILNQQLPRKKQCLQQRQSKPLNFSALY